MRWMRGWILVGGLAFAAPAQAGAELGIGGAAGGAFYEPDVGSTAFGAAASPLLSVQLDPWRGTLRPVVGLTSAPFFQYSMGYDAYTAPLIVADLGLLLGSDSAHGAITAHGGLLSFGASLRVTLLPLSLGQGRTGIELRATWLARWGGFGGALWVVRL